MVFKLLKISSPQFGAINVQFLQKKDLKNDIQNLDLIIDDGSENNNFTIHEIIKNCKVGIDKKIALKDVLFSNSLSESNNRIIKQTYLKNIELTQLELPNNIANSIKNIILKSHITCIKSTSQMKYLKTLN